MKKLLPHFTAFIFGLFALGVGAAVMYYSFHGLALLFPGDLLGQIFGLLLFDVGAFIWFLVFVAACVSTMQYVFAGIGFLIGIVGTLGLVGIEVGLSSGMLAGGSMQKELTYIFLGVLLGHLLLLYLHHGAAPHVSAEISLGIEKAKIVDKAEKDAEKILADNVALLSAPIAQELVKRVLQDLNLRPTQGDILDLPALSVDVAKTPAPGATVGGPLDILKGWILAATGKTRNYEQAAPVVELEKTKTEDKPTGEDASFQAGSAAG